MGQEVMALVAALPQVSVAVTPDKGRAGAISRVVAMIVVIVVMGGVAPPEVVVVEVDFSVVGVHK